MSEQHHISTDKLLFSVGGGLIVLTILTAAVHYLSLPQPWSIVAAMVIAISKAALVALFFMNLYWDDRFNSMLLVAALVFLSLLVGYSLMDVLFRPEIIPGF